MWYIKSEFENNNKKVWLGRVIWFNVILTFDGYLMLNPFYAYIRYDL